jgi:omega-hydroxy-beta-dihydromenaquinone-9 sulfotransferase
LYAHAADEAAGPPISLYRWPMSWRVALTRRIGPGGFAGSNLGDWCRILYRTGFAIEPRFWPRAALISANCLLNSCLGAWESFRYSAQIAQASVADPLFVLGVWRSGTTHLHNLLSQDKRFAFPTTYETYYPRTFLCTESWTARAIGSFLPATRPMDNVKFGFAEPQEDEFALAACGLSFLIGSMAFPRTGGHYRRYLTLRDASPAEAAAWKEMLLWFLQKLTVKHGRPLVLKSPGHTGRIKLLLEQFPQAKFVHIHRRPYDVFQSSLHTVRTANAYWALQSPGDEVADILRDYSDIYEAYFEQRSLIPAGNFSETTFDRLEHDPVGELRRVYAELNLPDFASVEPRLQQYVASLAGYSRNRFPPLPEDLRQRIAQAWKRSFDEWGYSIAE